MIELVTVGRGRISAQTDSQFVGRRGPGAETGDRPTTVRGTLRDQRDLAAASLGEDGGGRSTSVREETAFDSRGYGLTLFSIREPLRHAVYRAVFRNKAARGCEFSRLPTVERVFFRFLSVATISSFGRVRNR